MSGRLPSVEVVGFDRVSGFGPDHLWSRLAEGVMPAPPLLDPGLLSGRGDSPDLNRLALAERLAAYHERLGVRLASETLNGLRGDALMVVAGQQPGLLLGPTHAWLKALTAIGLAATLEAQTGRRVIPAFWVASEDHDLQEVHRVSCFGRELVLPHESLESGGPRPPVGRVSLEAHREDIVRFARETLADRPHGPALIEAVESAPFTSYADHFAGVMARVLAAQGLVMVDPLELTSLSQPVLRRVAGRWGGIEEALARGSESLAKAGFEPPLAKPGLFDLSSGHRLPVEHPERTDLADAELSGGAAIRPIVQDAILPAAATVAGPTEMLYLWQIDPLYAVAGVERSMLWPRCSATFAEASLVKKAERFGLHGAEMLGALRRLEQSPDEVDDGDLQRLRATMETLLSQIEALDEPAEKRVLEKARDSIAHQVQRVIDRVSQRRLEDAGVGRRRLEKIAEAIYPGGQPQERRPGGAMELLAEHGLGIADTLLASFDPLAIGHRWVVWPDVSAGAMQGAPS